MSTNSASLEAPGNGAIWVVQVLGAVLFFIAGFAKLSGDEQMIQTFADVTGGRENQKGVTDVVSGSPFPT